MHVRVLLALAGAALALLASVTSTLACTGVVALVLDPADARGYTFIATASEIDEVNDPALGEPHERATFSVERVYRGDVPTRLKIWTGVCHEPRGFVVGRRYLISTSSLEDPDAWNMLAWRLRGDDQLRLVSFDAALEDYPEAIARLRTIDEALTLMRAGLPDTSTATEDVRLAVVLRVAMLGATLLAVAAVARRWPVRAQPAG